MLDVTELLEEARKRTHLDDFGDDAFREGLDRLVASLNAEGELRAAGEAQLREQFIDLLCSRLGVEDWWKRHPEIGDQRIEAPIFVIGLPRTGTTALQDLLAQDPDTRFLRTWESNAPTPPPDPSLPDDPRIAQARARLAATHEALPALRAMHDSEAEGPTECQDLLGMSFRAHHLEGTLTVPTYSRWLRDCDMRPAYRTHERVLKLLQWRCPPRRWALKSPVHLYSLEALVDVYPDARFVWTHRDPAKVLASVCSLTNLFLGMGREIEPTAWGEQQAEQWCAAVRIATDFRNRVGDDRFVDVQFGDFCDAPLATLEACYAALGLPMTDTARNAIDRRSREKPRGVHGVHRYRLEDWGLDAEAVHERFAFYLERFSVPIER